MGSKNIYVWKKDEKLGWIEDEITEIREGMEYRDIDDYEKPDLINLNHLNEPSILNTVHKRYMSDSIYTYTGPILIAVNPFKEIDIYGKDIALQVSKTQSNNKSIPHVYEISKNAFKGLNIENQSILVSGESGAGKTVTTKFVMQYIADTIKTDDNTNIEKQILESNPILEAFGNAMTRRNDNSSRFGKFIQMCFNENKLYGAVIKTYLLERVRVIKQYDGERNFHIFYQMLSSINQKTLQEYKLTSNPDDYVILQGGKSVNYKRKDGVSDSSEYKKYIKALKTLNIIESNTNETSINCLETSNISEPSNNNKVVLSDINRIIAGLLHLGNMYRSDNNKNSNFDLCAELFGIEKNNLQSLLTEREITAGKEICKIPLTDKECENARDVLLKNIYSGLFGWILGKINNCINDKQYILDNNLINNKSQFIGILDIFGFEVFNENGFEQLCINYTNEVLQKLFTDFTIKVEQEEYKKENIEWKHIVYQDNTECLSMISDKGSIFSLLDEQSLVPNGSDGNFFRNICKKMEKYDNFMTEPTGTVKLEFIIKHYAGDVTYISNGFLDKNRDWVSKKTCSILGESKNNIVNNFDFTEFVDTKMTRTISKQFQLQLNELQKIISNTKPHFIRCIKPNDENISNCFDRNRVLEQLKYSGILEAIRVAKSGYPVNISYESIEDRYWFLYKPIMENIDINKDTNTTDIKQLFSKINKENSDSIIDSFDYQLGKTKVFMKRYVYEKLEILKSQKIGKYSSVICAYARRKIYRDKYCEIIDSSRSLLKNVQMINERNSFIRKYNSILEIKRFIRCIYPIKEYNRLYEINLNKKSLDIIWYSYIMYINRFNYIIKKSAAIKIQKWYKKIYNKNINKKIVSILINDIIDTTINITNPQETTLQILLDENDDLNNKYKIKKEENDVLEKMLIMSNSQNEELINKVNNMQDEIRKMKIRYRQQYSNQSCSLM